MTLEWRKGPLFCVFYLAKVRAPPFLYDPPQNHYIPSTLHTLLLTATHHTLFHVGCLCLHCLRIAFAKPWPHLSPLRGRVKSEPHRSWTRRPRQGQDAAVRHILAKADAGEDRAEGDVEGTGEEVVQTAAKAMTKAGMVMMLRRRRRNLTVCAMFVKDVAISRREVVVQQDVGMEEGKGLMMLSPNL
jgi:hypothetical protein